MKLRSKAPRSIAQYALCKRIYNIALADNISVQCELYNQRALTDCMIALANHTQNHTWEISDKIEDKKHPACFMPRNQGEMGLCQYSRNLQVF